MLIAAIFTIGGKFIFSLPFLFVILSGLKIKGFTALTNVSIMATYSVFKELGKFNKSI